MCDKMRKDKTKTKHNEWINESINTTQHSTMHEALRSVTWQARKRFPNQMTYFNNSLSLIIQRIDRTKIVVLSCERLTMYWIWSTMYTHIKHKHTFTKSFSAVWLRSFKWKSTQKKKAHIPPLFVFYFPRHCQQIDSTIASVLSQNVIEVCCFCWILMWLLFGFELQMNTIFFHQRPIKTKSK